MRKRSGRQPRYAAIPNETIDDAPHLDFMALGLLNVLLRHRDGWDITLAEIGSKYGYGRDAMSGAMGLLQVARYVIKIRLMSVEGNQWSTEVCVYDTPATNTEVAALLADAEAEPGVKRAQVIEPTATAIAAAKKRLVKLQPKRKQAPSVAVPRVPENPHSGATCGNGENSQVGPECRDSRQSGDPAVFKKTVVEKESEKTEAPAGRSPVDGRSPSTPGSSGDEAASGCAASGKTAPFPTPNDETHRPARNDKGGSKKAAHTREQLDLVRRVRALFPPELLDNGLPDLPALSSAILTAMDEGRTVEQMGERIWYRWSNHGFADIWDENHRFEKPVGVAIALVQPLRRGDRFACPDPRCENGADIDTKVPCRLCAVRIADWKADRVRERGQVPPTGTNSPRTGSGSPDPVMPPQRAAQPRTVPLLKDCGNDLCPASTPAAGGPLCGTCRDDELEAEQRTQELLASWEAEKAAAAVEAPPADEIDEDALETARIRAELAAQYGTPEQVEAYCSTAPF
ncbi:hypothetical protein OG693_39445 (plasmid) [Streptomyces sp. NBC_01259]|uniref:hypothetical protein n=1 Tax=Streptomyces sp. NBC_01259 TaxID=2903800 RepID=UPI002F913465